MKNSTRAHWSAVLEDYRRSGLGVQDFCNRRGVSVQAFYLRRRQLTSPAPDIVIELPSRERVLVPQEASEVAVATVLLHFHRRRDRRGAPAGDGR